MTCAKRRVTCTLADAAGHEVVGENACANPQAVCPRRPGEGYEKCKSVCEQGGHAEVQALALWRRKYPHLKPPVAVIRGHYYICEDCGGKLRDAGVQHVHLKVTA
jgi:hypothetical protein